MTEWQAVPQNCTDYGTGIPSLAVIPADQGRLHGCVRTPRRIRRTAATRDAAPTTENYLGCYHLNRHSEAAPIAPFTPHLRPSPARATDSRARQRPSAIRLSNGLTGFDRK